MTLQAFVEAQSALADIQEVLKKHPAIVSGELSGAEAKIVADSPDEWLISVELTRPRFTFFGIRFGSQAVQVYVKGNRQHQREGSLVITGNCIEPDKDAGPMYGIWEIPDCSYIAADLTYERLLQCLRGEHSGR